MKKRIVKNIDWGILICAIILCTIGTIALFSATHDSGFDSLQKQILWLVICIPFLFWTIFIEYEFIAKISPIFYRFMYIIINWSFIYCTNQWCKKLVRFQIVYFSAIRAYENFYGSLFGYDNL